MGRELDTTEFDALLARYGSELDAWPIREARLARSLLAQSSLALSLLQQHREMHELLGSLPDVDLGDLESRVTNQRLPPQSSRLLESILDWLIPEPDSLTQWWRPATVACLPLLFGIVMGNYFSFGVEQQSTVENWEDEFSMLAFSDYSEVDTL